MRLASQVFLAYAKEDINEVEKVYDELVELGYNPWLDTKNILPGEIWKDGVKSGIVASDLSLILLSNSSISKKGNFQDEIQIVLDIIKEKKKGDKFVIPVRLEEIQVPTTLSNVHGIDLYKKDGKEQLKEVLST